MCYARVPGKYSRRDNRGRTGAFGELIGRAGRRGAIRRVAGSKGRREHVSPAATPWFRGCDLTESRRVPGMSNMVFFAEIGATSSLDCVSTICPLLTDPGQTDKRVNSDHTPTDR